ncbi:TetR/AcrR family transcriptional regulator [Paraferrimonas sedimenticola]|uniref:TetR family transcriptional regulator n=1 Tax=Paraferrimonas sedimenticola TaxID=375674 RepID=A0AA37W2H4_9GAMM|nr:TetR/AcrR family transcriptional regulator [Paraferrimonas sedimenticola]GLP97797.1 TetR family transcriptional regulator [Paraferrimonas sedimenticola]
MSSQTKNKVGRPTDTQDNRARLLDAARELFMELDYSKVSTRKIAALAGTDPGLIRYYFGSKAQLFSAMLKETSEPVMQALQHAQRQASPTSLAEMLNRYYQVMVHHPQFPKMLLRIASADESDPQAVEIKKLLFEVVHPGEIQVFDQLKKAGVLGDDVDPELARISFFSLTIFPFLMPDRFRTELNLKMTPEFLDRLAKHNGALLEAMLAPTKELT